MRQTFTPATRPELAAETITRLAARTDVYVGVLLRHRRAGGRHACERSHLAFVEIDRPDAPQRLARYRCPPTMIDRLGGSPGHAHAYWQLQRARRPRRARDTPTADSRSASAATSPPSTPPASSDRRPPGIGSAPRRRRVELLELQPARRYQLAELTAGLTDPSPRRGRSARASRAATSDLDRQLLAIPAATYVPALTGRQPNRAGKIRCPFHDDHTPSLQLYDHGWYCFGACRTGGSIYDFGALLYGLDTRGHAVPRSSASASPANCTWRRRPPRASRRRLPSRARQQRPAADAADQRTKSPGSRPSRPRPGVERR